MDMPPFYALFIRALPHEEVYDRLGEIQRRSESAFPRRPRLYSALLPRRKPQPPHQSLGAGGRGLDKRTFTPLRSYW